MGPWHHVAKQSWYALLAMYYVCSSGYFWYSRLTMRPLLTLWTPELNLQYALIRYETHQFFPIIAGQCHRCGFSEQLTS